MIYIQSAFSQEEQRLELVGRQGEGGTRQLVFDCADVLAEYPDALIVCAMQRAGDHKAYLKDCAADGANRVVTLESADVAVPGVLKIELRALIGDDVRKSAVYIAKVAESLRGEQDRPGNPTADVLNRIDMTISRAEESIAEANAAAQSAREVADTVQAKLDNGDFVGEKGIDGKDGSDASVTKDNVVRALGYTPENIVLKAQSSTAILGAELVSATGWILGSGWSGDTQNGFAHTSGTETLAYSMAEGTKGKCYQISFKSSETMTDSNLYVRIGESPLFNLYFEEHDDGTISVGVLATENGNLEFVPAASYKGTIINISVCEVIGTFTPIKQLLDASGKVSTEIYAPPLEQNNLYIGTNAGHTNTTGNRNVAVGANALKSNLSGWRNIAIGSGALKSNTAGSRNTALGEDSLSANLSGQRNIAIGASTLTKITNSNRNIAIGADSMFNAEECDDCVAIGFASLNKNRGNKNYGIGTMTLYKTTGAMNLAFGYSAGYGITSGADNVAIGANTMYRTQTGKNNVAIGSYALVGATGSDYSSNNTAIGYSAGRNIGRYSQKNVLIGANSAETLSGEDYCIVIGADQDVNSGEDYQLNIGGLLKGSTNPSNRNLKINGGLNLAMIPTTDPQVAGQVWNDDGTLKISTGN